MGRTSFSPLTGIGLISTEYAHQYTLTVDGRFSPLTGIGLISTPSTETPVPTTVFQSLNRDWINFYALALELALTVSPAVSVP